MLRLDPGIIFFSEDEEVARSHELRDQVQG